MSQEPWFPLLLESSSDRFHVGISCLSWALPIAVSTVTELLSPRKRGEDRFRAGPLFHPDGWPWWEAHVSWLYKHKDGSPSPFIPPSFFRVEMCKAGEEGRRPPGSPGPHPLLGGISRPELLVTPVRTSLQSTVGSAPTHTHFKHLWIWKNAHCIRWQEKKQVM